MLVSKKELIQQLKENNGEGIVLYNEIPYRILLTNEGTITATGEHWTWQQTNSPSSHGDYQIETDEIIKSFDHAFLLPDNISYQFYKNINNYSTPT